MYQTLVIFVVEKTRDNFEVLPYIRGESRNWDRQGLSSLWKQDKDEETGEGGRKGKRGLILLFREVYPAARRAGRPAAILRAGECGYIFLLLGKNASYTHVWSR